MYLSQEEERILDGESGWANQISMRILVQLGELFDATKLIPIESAHVSGVSYKTLGDAPIEFLKALADSEGKVKVRATLNPQSFSPEYLDQKLPQHIRYKQFSILEQFERMGFIPSLTCTPYYMRRPKYNSELAWAESSAVVYSNSVLRAWTNREGGPSALAAAIIGKTPDCGIHRAENRQVQVQVSLEGKFKNETNFGALGIYLGKILRNRIPTIDIPKRASADDLKQLSAALATTGMVNMFCRNDAPKYTRVERITIGTNEITQTIEDLSTAPHSEPDLIFIGCPHCSLNELKRISQLTAGHKVKNGMECWICTSRYIRQKAVEHVNIIERSGIRVLTDMCTVVSWTEMLGIRTIMTNSAKTAYYAPTLNKAETILAPMKECLKQALKG